MFAIDVRSRVLPGTATQAARRLKGFPWFAGTIFVAFVVAAAIGPWAVLHDPTRVSLDRTFLPPAFAGGDWSYPLGTDGLGRDVLSRLVSGARVDGLVSVAVVGLSGALGLVIALIAGYFGGPVDAVLMRFTDTALGFPFLLFGIVVVGTFGASAQNVILIVALAGWAQYARVLRGQIFALKVQDFVAMARVMGANPFWIMRRHLLPNISGSLFVLATLQVGVAILAEGSLSFLGLGVPPPAASWGGMLAEGRNSLTTAWWIPVFPGLAITATVLAANQLGDWLRLLSNPTERG